jgi:hypothetical protein
MTEADAIVYVVDDDAAMRQSLQNLIGSVAALALPSLEHVGPKMAYVLPSSQLGDVTQIESVNAR